MSCPAHKCVGCCSERAAVERAWSPRQRRYKRANVVSVAALACGLVLTTAMAPLLSAEQLHEERAVKVAFVFNLTKYVEWPHPIQELTIGFVGEGPMGESLQKVLDGRTSESRRIRVLLFPSDEQLQQCNIVYIAESAPKKIREFIEKLRSKSILTVGDSDSFAHNGGMVGLVLVGDQVQIQVNLQATHEAHLKISSRVLELSHIVQPAPAARN